MSNVTTSLKYAGQELTQLVGSGTVHDSVVVRKNIDVRPRRRVTKILIPGRNGAQYVDDDVFENVTISYTFVFASSYTNCDALVNFLLAQNGFNRLEDAYDTDIYRMARVSGVLNPNTPDDNMGYLEVNFECQPERWLKTGETTTTILEGASANFVNPTSFNARPLIRVYGDNAEVKIRLTSQGANVYKYSFTVADGIYPTVNSFLVDSDKEDCYDVEHNWNSYVTFNGDSHSFPIFEGGKTAVVSVQSGDIDKVVITPRWWKL